MPSPRPSAAPMVVAAASCRDVVLRWRSVLPADAPRPRIARYVVQRFPDARQHPRWGTLLAANTSELVDPDVRPAAEYLYRVQAVSADASGPSAFAYHSVRVATAGCPLSGTWPVLVRTSADVLVPLVRMDVLQALGAVCTCLLVVYGVVRISALGMQRTLRRQSHLRHLRQAAATASAAAVASKKRPQSMTASDSSTENSSTDPLQQQNTTLFDSFRSLHSEDPVDADTRAATTHPEPKSKAVQITRAASLPSNADRAAFCAYCHKRFGLFRRRRICSVCHSTALCRKCGIRGSTEELRRSVIKLQAALEAQRSSGETRQPLQKEKPIKIICRDCCLGAQRYSSAPSVRPSFPARSSV